MDLGVFNNRISLSADVYWRKCFDLIGILRTMGIGGEPLKYANYADMKSNGVEFTLNTKNVQAGKFDWTSNLTFSFNQNEITNLRSEAGVMDLVSSTGYPKEGEAVRGIYAIPFMGLTSEGLPTYLNQDNEITTSDINFQERTKVDFLKYMGTADPKYTGGFDNTFKYGPLKLSVFLTYQFGSKIWLYPYFRYRYYDNESMPKEFADRWMLPGDEYITNVPAIATVRDADNYPYLDRAFNAYNYSDVRVAKGDFIRLKDIYVTYTVPSKWLKHIGLSTASLRVAVSNVALLHSDKKLKGQDPEFVRSGGVALPVPRQFTCTLKFGF